MPIDKTLLEILVCPETKAPVALANELTVTQLNKRIARGELHTTTGATVGRLLTEALIREDGKRVYPIVDGIPVMLIDEGINL